MRLFLLVASLATIVNLAHAVSERCGFYAEVLPDISAMVPCSKGTVNMKGEPIQDARNFLNSNIEYTYSTAPAPAFSFYGHWSPTPNSGPNGEDGCVFYEYATDMQVAGRWQPTCPTPTLAWWVIFACGMVGGTILLPILIVCFVYFFGKQCNNATMNCCASVETCFTWIGTSIAGCFCFWRRRQPKPLQFPTPQVILVPPTTQQPWRATDSAGLNAGIEIPPPFSTTTTVAATSNPAWGSIGSSSAPHLRIDDEDGCRIVVSGTQSINTATSLSFNAHDFMTPLAKGTLTTTHAIQVPSRTQDLQYFELRVAVRDEATAIRVGVAAKPMSAVQLPGSTPQSVAINLSSGNVYLNGSVSGTVSLPEVRATKRCPALCVGIGIRHSSRTVLITIDGVVAWEKDGLDSVLVGSSWRLYPVVGASGSMAPGDDCIVTANFGQQGFMWFDANARRAGSQQL